MAVTKNIKISINEIQKVFNLIDEKNGYSFEFVSKNYLFFKNSRNVSSDMSVICESDSDK